MEHPQPETATVATGRSPNDSVILRGFAGASVGMGFFSLCVFWWTPFAGSLATVGLILGLICLIIGVKGGLRRENYAAVGVALCAISLSVSLTLNQFLRYLMWDQW